jgi:phosphorylcholine metabolism protein LicD
MEHGGKKKYNKRAFVFTNGAGMTGCRTRDLKEMAQDLRATGIKLNIIPIDFMVTYDI